jgi:polysaccharide pyruvyl transferase WcaK-like protein
MSHALKRRAQFEPEPVRVLGRGLRAERGVHLGLRSVREATGKTQVDVARESQIDQADVSRLEGRADFDDCQVATLRRYLAAIGGELEITARFGNKRIVVVGVSPGPATTPANKALRTGRKPARR